MARLGKSDFVKGERMSWLEGYVKEFPDSTPEDIVWAWMFKNYQAQDGDEKVLFDALDKVWEKYGLYDKMYHVDCHKEVHHEMKLDFKK